MSYLGVSAEFIRNILKEIEDKKLTEKDALERYVKQSTLGKNCPYQNLYQDTCGQDGRPLVQAATTLVSHAWKNSMRQTLETTLEYDKENEGEHYYWLDIFAVNQHLGETPSSFFESGLREVTRQTKATLLILSPWDSPAPLTRVWCLWEIMNTILQKNKLVVQLPAREKERFREAIVGDFNAVTKVMMEVDVQKADATKARDKEMIFKAIEDNPNVGFYSLNETVKEQMRRWVADSGTELADGGEGSKEKVELLLSLVGMYQALGDFDQMQRLSLRGLEIAEKIDLGSRWTKDFFNALGNAYNAKGEYDQAIAYHKKALEIYKKISGETHQDTAGSYNNLGSAYYSVGEYDRAIKYYAQALEIDKKISGETHPDVATSYNNLGNAYESKGEYDQAIKYHAQALEIFKHLFGEKHPKIGTSYNNLGSAYASMGEYDQAIKYHAQALEIFKHLFGESHPDTAMSYNNLGEAYNDKGEYDQAIEYHARALEIKKHVLGKKHPGTALSYNNLGNAYRALGNTYYAKSEYEKAIPHYAQALQIQKEALGEGHPDIIQSYNKLGNAYYHMGEYKRAADHYGKALEILKGQVRSTPKEA